MIATTFEMCQYYLELTFAGPKETEKVYGCTTKLVYLPSLIDKLIIMIVWHHWTHHLDLTISSR